MLEDSIDSRRVVYEGDNPHRAVHRRQRSGSTSRSLRSSRAQEALRALVKAGISSLGPLSVAVRAFGLFAARTRFA
jgi:hypothetical protein